MKKPKAWIEFTLLNHGVSRVKQWEKIGRGRTACPSSVQSLTRPFNHRSRTAIGVEILQNLFFRNLFQKSWGFVSSSYRWGEARRISFFFCEWFMSAINSTRCWLVQ